MIVVDLYTIQVVLDEAVDPPNDYGPFGFNTIRALMSEAEENLTDLLPPGYRARIRRWDDYTDEANQEDDDE